MTKLIKLKKTPKTEKQTNKIIEAQYVLKLCKSAFFFSCDPRNVHVNIFISIEAIKIVVLYQCVTGLRGGRRMTPA